MSSYSTGTAAKTAAALAIAIAAVMAIGGFVSVYAQNDAQNETDERLLACAAIGDTVERIACFDDVVEGMQQDTKSSEVASTESPAMPTAVESPSEVLAPVVAGAVATATVVESTNASAPEESRVMESAEASSNSAVENFGIEDQTARADKEQKKQEEKEKEKESEIVSVNSTIMRSVKSGEYHFVVVLENGQVWEETDGSRRIGLPRVGMTVEIKKGLFGSYRMKIGDDNRVARVRRLR